MLTAEQTIAIGRKCGAHHYRFVVEHDQHGLAKVNFLLGSVKIFFLTCGGYFEIPRSRLTTRGWAHFMLVLV